MTNLLSLSDDELSAKYVRKSLFMVGYSAIRSKLIGVGQVLASVAERVGWYVVSAMKSKYFFPVPCVLIITLRHYANCLSENDATFKVKRSFT